MTEQHAEVVAYLLSRIHELEGQVDELTTRLRLNSDKQKQYRRSKLTAARSNDDVTETSRCSNEVVTPLPQNGNAANSSPSQTLPLLVQVQEKINTYGSDLSRYVAATWPSSKALTGEQEKAWREANPGVDLVGAAKAARAWQLEDLQRRTRPRVFAFLGNWFRTSQQKIPAGSVLTAHKANEIAKRDVARTLKRNAELDAVKAAPMPESLKAFAAKIGHGK